MTFPPAGRRRRQPEWASRKLLGGCPPKRSVEMAVQFRLSPFTEFRHLIGDEDLRQAETFRMTLPNCSAASRCDKASLTSVSG